MDQPTRQLEPEAADLEEARRQHAALHTSLGWLLTYAEPNSALLPDPSLPAVDRLRRSVRTFAWNSEQIEKLAGFAERVAELEAEASQAFGGGTAWGALAGRLERAAAEALQHYMALMADSPKGAQLSRTNAEEDDSAARTRARAEIGAAVRARLDSDPRAERLPTVGLELYRVRDFADSGHCAQIVELIERDLFPSEVLGANEGFRTSKSCNLPATEPAVALFEENVALLLGVNGRFSERVQGQRYEVGQQFKPHFDYFHKAESYYEDVATTGGQRTWTAMLFLNRPDEGGYTNFPDAAVRAAPEPGTLLVWNNMDRAGRPNDHSLHQGMPVEAGRKYVLTKWFRERPLWF